MLKFDNISNNNALILKNAFLIFTICFTTFSLYLNSNKVFPSIFDSQQTNINNLIESIDLEYDNNYKRDNNNDSVNYLKAISKIIIERYNHAFYLYDFSENFTLHIFSLFTDQKHKGIVHPNHLAQGNIGICSQQSILCMTIAQQKGYKTRPVKLNKHYICEVYANGSWHILDTDLKVSLLDKKEIASAEDLKNDKKLQSEYYSSSIKSEDNYAASHLFDTVNYGKVNTFDAPNLILLHKATFLLSDYLWIVCWIVSLKLFINKKAIKTKLLTNNIHE